MLMIQNIIIAEVSLIADIGPNINTIIEVNNIKNVSLKHPIPSFILLYLRINVNTADIMSEKWKEH